MSDRRADLTNDAFRRWLRAQRPDMPLFLRLDPEEQETLALLGDEYMVDLAVTLGEAVRDPTAAGARSGDLGAEADLLTRLVAQRIHETQNASEMHQAPRPMPTTLSGFGERRRAAQAATRAPTDIFGRKR